MSQTCNECTCCCVTHLYTAGLLRICSNLHPSVAFLSNIKLYVFLFVSVRTALIAIIGFMPTKGEGAIGSLDYTPEERRALAKK